MSLDRRTFILSTSVAAFAALAPRLSGSDSSSSAVSPAGPFLWQTSDLVFSFDVIAGKLRQGRLVPVGTAMQKTSNSFGVEIALQCSGENSPDQGMKSGMGQPGARLMFVSKHEESTPTGKRLVFMHADPVLRLNVEFVYELMESPQYGGTRGSTMLGHRP
jgi:alpha-galactosidase